MARVARVARGWLLPGDRRDHPPPPLLQSPRNPTTQTTTNRRHPPRIATRASDGNGLDKLEFVIGMLTKLELVSWETVEPFLQQFDTLDTDCSGQLTSDDLEKLADMFQEQVDHARGCNGCNGCHGCNVEKEQVDHAR